MPAQLRPDMKLAKLAYKLMKVEKDQQQKPNPSPSDERKKEWASTYTKSAAR